MAHLLGAAMEEREAIKILLHSLPMLDPQEMQEVTGMLVLLVQQEAPEIQAVLPLV